MSLILKRIGSTAFSLNRRYVTSMGAAHPKSQFQEEEEKLEREVEEKRKPDLPAENMENPYKKERLECILCKYGITVDYKNVKLLSQFVSSYTGKVYGKHITGLCTRQQTLVEEAIIRSTNAGFMAGYLKEVSFLKDPKLFDPDRPLRPHPY